MRLCLVIPNSCMAVTPIPVGLGYLSYAVISARGDETLIVDARKLRLSESATVSHIIAFNPDVVGVTAMTFEASEAISLISTIKQQIPGVPVLFGGAHATGCGASLLNTVEADYLVIGEGENTLVELLTSLENSGDVSAVKGLAWRNGEEIVFNGERPLIENMDKLDIDWEGIGPEKYFGLWTRNAGNTVAKTGRRLPVFTSRGCPFGCIYCHRIFGRKYRVFSSRKIVTDMLSLRNRYRVREFEIIDDTFNLELDRSKELMQAIIDADLKCSLAFSGGLRVDRVDDELLDLMVRAGTYRINYAVESASSRIQKLIGKNLDIDSARQVINNTVSKNVITGVYYMLGFPGETQEEMSLTIDFAVSLRNHVASFAYMQPFPGTEVARSSLQIDQTVRETVFRDSTGLCINMSAVSNETLQKMRQKANRRFYFSPRRILRILRDVPGNPRLLASALTALRLSFRENVNY